MTIVIYENEKNDLDSMLSILSGAGYADVKAVASLVELAQSLGLNEFDSSSEVRDVDLIVFDITNERNAIDYCRKIKDCPRYEDTPLIIVSAQTAPETLQTAFAYGANDFIPKPIRSYEFLARIRSSLIFKHETDRRKARERELLEATRQLSDLNAVLNRLSLIDGLTGISNRRFFDQSILQEWRLSFRNERPLATILMDVDHFKSYNDNYGHQAGDQVLKKIAQCIRGCMRRPTDLLARYGGEEFAAILPDTDLPGALFVAERIITTINGISIPHGKSETSDRVTISIGVSACVPTDQLSSSDLVESADQALYAAKDAGRNQACSGEPIETSNLKKVD